MRTPLTDLIIPLPIGIPQSVGETSNDPTPDYLKLEQINKSNERRVQLQYRTFVAQ
jgi:hypothetical protein